MWVPYNSKNIEKWFLGTVLIIMDIPHKFGNDKANRGIRLQKMVNIKAQDSVPEENTFFKSCTAEIFNPIIKNWHRTNSLQTVSLIFKNNSASYSSRKL